jgi:hypothetical protein
MATQQYQYGQSQDLYKSNQGGSYTQFPLLNSALSDWSKGLGQYSNMMGAALSPLQQQMQAYQPGGGYGQGQRQQAQENVQQGVSQDLGGMVASGMSSMAGARGVGTRAGSELSKLYGNIEDTRNQLLNQATGNYANAYSQMMLGYGDMIKARPTYTQNQYVMSGSGQRANPLGPGPGQAGYPY